jgi:hypothetical protein
MSNTRNMLISLENISADELVPDDGISFDNADDAQHALDAEIEKLKEIQEEHQDLWENMDGLTSHHERLMQIREGMASPIKNATISEESYNRYSEGYNGILLNLGLPGQLLPSLEAFREDTTKSTSIALEAIDAAIGKTMRAITEFSHKIDVAILNFCLGYQGVCNRTINVLAEADRILDKANSAPKAKKLTIAGSAYKSLQAGRKDFRFQDAIDLTHRNGEEFVNKYMPEVVNYAKDMAHAFSESDLTKVRHTLGIDKAGFMKLAAPFADVKAPIPSFCSKHGEKHYFFGLIKDDYRETLTSDDLPGNKKIQLTHPSGNLRALLDREDAKGFYQHFISWLSVYITVEKVKAERNRDKLDIDTPTPQQIRSDISKMRELVKGIRNFSLKSDEYQQAVKLMLDAWESHWVKAFDTPGDKLAHGAMAAAIIAGDVYFTAATAGAIKAGNAGGLLAARAGDAFLDVTVGTMFIGFSHLGANSGRLLACSIINVGGYFADELRNLATLSLRMAKQYQ